MRSILFEMSAAPGLAHSLCDRLGLQRGTIDRRQFPDGETYLRFENAVKDRDVILLCTLDRPNTKALPLMFAAQAAKDHGAKRLGLIAPYLAYMRQDKEFREGEAVTSKGFADLLAHHFDWLVTIDPHLHRYPSLDALYTIPTAVAHAAGPVADWVRTNVHQPAIVGPDEESSQWANAIASLAGVRHIVLRKIRRGDYSVSIDGSELAGFSGTPVLVDDIASSAKTMIETVRMLKCAGIAAPVCAVVHPIFAGDSYQRLLDAGAQRIVSTNAVTHETNRIDISEPLAQAVERLERQNSGRASTQECRS